MRISFSPFRELASGLESFSAASSPASRGGIAGFTEAITNPRAVLQRGQMSELMESIRPQMEDVWQRAKEGDMAGAVQGTVATVGEIVQRTGDMQFADHISRQLLAPVVAQYRNQRIGDLMGEIDPDRPETFKNISKQISSLDPALGRELLQSYSTANKELFARKVEEKRLEMAQEDQTMQRILFPLQMQQTTQALQTSAQALSTSQTQQEFTQKQIDTYDARQKRADETHQFDVRKKQADAEYAEKRIRGELPTKGATSQARFEDDQYQEALIRLNRLVRGDAKAGVKSLPVNSPQVRAQKQITEMYARKQGFAIQFNPEGKQFYGEPLPVKKYIYTGPKDALAPAQ